MGEFDEISYSKASKNTTQLAEMSNKPKIPILDEDPINPENGQFWLLKFYGLLKDTFTGVDGTPLDADNWEVVKTKTTGSTATHAATNKADIRSNMAQFNVAAAEAIGDGGKVEILARMRKFQIDWTTEKRIITWKQNSYKQWGELGLVLSSSLAVEGGSMLPSAAIKVDFNQTNTSLIMKNLAQTEIVYNQSFAHGATINTISEYKLVIDPATANVTLYQDGVQKLTTTSPNIGLTKAWLYLEIASNSTTPTIRNFDDVTIE